MYKIFITTIVLGIALLNVQSAIYAQVTTANIVVVTPYNEGQNLDFFFQNSIHPIADVTNKGEPSVFVSIITSAQMEKYKQAGFAPTVIDTNAGDLNQYYMISTNKGNTVKIDRTQLDDPQLKERGMEFIYPLSSIDYIMKLKKGVYFVDVRTGPLKGIAAKQIHRNLYPPVDKTTKRAFKRKSSSQTNITKSNGYQGLDVLSIILGLGTGGMIYYFLRSRKTKNS